MTRKRPLVESRVGVRMSVDVSDAQQFKDEEVLLINQMFQRLTDAGVGTSVDEININTDPETAEVIFSSSEVDESVVEAVKAEVRNGFAEAGVTVLSTDVIAVTMTPSDRVTSRVM